MESKRVKLRTQTTYLSCYPLPMLLEHLASILNRPLSFSNDCDMFCRVLPEFRKARLFGAVLAEDELNQDGEVWCDLLGTHLLISVEELTRIRFDMWMADELSSS